MLKLWYSSSKNVFENLALETHLLKETQGAHLLFWVNEPSVVIGRNQNAWKEVHIDHVYQDEALIARRLSGGGAVYHDLGNLNVSFINAGSKEEDFDAVFGVMKSLGLEIERDQRDGLWVKGKKFSGSAYYMYQKRKLHHLTLLVDANLDLVWRYLKKEEPQINDRAVASVRSPVVNLKDVVPTLSIEQILEAFSSHYHEALLVPQQVFEDEKYASQLKAYKKWHWVYGQSPKFEVPIKHQGETLNIVVKGGLVHEITPKNQQIFADHTLEAMIGQPFNPHAIQHLSL